MLLLERTSGLTKKASFKLLWLWIMYIKKVSIIRIPIKLKFLLGCLLGAIKEHKFDWIRKSIGAIQSVSDPPPQFYRGLLKVLHMPSTPQRANNIFEWALIISLQSNKISKVVLWLPDKTSVFLQYLQKTLLWEFFYLNILD